MQWSIDWSIGHLLLFIYLCALLLNIRLALQKFEDPYSLSTYLTILFFFPYPCRYDPVELERKRQEMMADAQVRDTERSKNVAHYQKVEESDEARNTRLASGSSGGFIRFVHASLCLLIWATFEWPMAWTSWGSIDCLFDWLIDWLIDWLTDLFVFPFSDEWSYIVT